MTAVALALLAIAALAPLALTLCRPSGVRGRRETALAVHRAQLAELDRDLADGRIAAAEHAQAVLEVQRRLLAAADAPEDIADDGGARVIHRGPLLAALLLVPLAAGGLYLLGGHPELPAAPLAARLAHADRERMEATALVATLRQRLTQLDPKSEMTRQGYELMGNVEVGLGNLAQAAEAWRTALAIRFDPGLAAELAEAQTRLDGRVTPADSGIVPPGAGGRGAGCALASSRRTAAVGKSLTPGGITPRDQISSRDNLAQNRPPFVAVVE